MCHQIHLYDTLFFSFFFYILPFLAPLCYCQVRSISHLTSYPAFFCIFCQFIFYSVVFSYCVLCLCPIPDDDTMQCHVLTSCINIILFFPLPKLQYKIHPTAYLETAMSYVCEIYSHHLRERGIKAVS